VTRVLIVGTGMTPFGNQRGVGTRRLAVAAVDEALKDAGVPAEDVGRIFYGNAAAGVVSHQEMIRGQVALRKHALACVPVFNVENACASGSSAVNLAFDTIRAGAADVVIAMGVEQLNHEDKSRAFNALRGSTDIDEIGEGIPGQVAANSVLMDYYAAVAQAYLDQYEATPKDFALVAVKNRRHAADNPLAHLRTPQTVEDVLGSRMISAPLTLPMCSPLTDGAAALVLCSEAYARKLNVPALEIVASQLAAGTGQNSSPVHDAANAVYRASGYGPTDFDLIELHDAAAPAELLQYAEIGLCEEGRGHHLVRNGDTTLGGRIPVNTSGGLLSRGHPLGATGCAQLVELCTQLRGRADRRQVKNARLAMAVNGGGWLDGTYAVAVATIVRRIAS
jgi:acetyl-CoA acetyltransferase